MKPEFDDSFLGDTRDALDAPDQGFDWQALYQRLNEDAASGDNEGQLSQVVIRLLQMLLPMSGRRIQPQSLGLRLIALAWVLNPGYFEGSPSVSRLARRCGMRPAALANYTGYYSRLLGWRNRGQRHAWNWQRHRKPVLRGGAKRKLKRNVPAVRKAPVSSGEIRPVKAVGGVAPGAPSRSPRAGRE